MKFLIFLLLVGCGPRPIVLEAIVPKVTAVKKHVENIKRVSDKLKETVVKVDETVEDLGEDLKEASKEAERLKDVGSATQDELNTQWERITKIEANHIILKGLTKEAVGDAEILTPIVEKATVDVKELETKAKENDKEVVILKDKYEKQMPDAALGKSVKFIVGTIAVGIVAFLIFKGLKKAAIL